MSQQTFLTRTPHLLNSAVSGGGSLIGSPQPQRGRLAPVVTSNQLKINKFQNNWSVPCYAVRPLKFMILGRVG